MEYTQAFGIRAEGQMITHEILDLVKCIVRVCVATVETINSL